MGAGTTRPLIVDAAVIAAVVDHAAIAAPREACGVVVGADDRAVSSIPITNRAGSDDAFLMDADELLGALMGLDATGEAVVGTYHSHPRGPAIPSVTDRAGAVPGWTLVVVGVDGSVRAWLPVPGGFAERGIARDRS